MVVAFLELPTMSSENGDKPQREVKNHLLFEIATEVAHRGKFRERMRRRNSRDSF